jgi:hexosaminidase
VLQILLSAARPRRYPSSQPRLAVAAVEPSAGMVQWAAAAVLLAPGILMVASEAVGGGAGSSSSSSQLDPSAAWWRRELLMPAPASVVLGTGRLTLPSEPSALRLASVGRFQSTIVDAALSRLPVLLYGASVRQCRVPPCNATRACNSTRDLGVLTGVHVNLTEVGGNWSGLAQGSDESYTLEVGGAAGVASVTAPTAAGAVHALETLAQLVKVAFGDRVGAICSAPLRVVDAPRFSWRGMMVDSSRHFLPVPTLLKMIDALAATKGNVL